MIQFSSPKPLLKTIKITALGFIMAFAVLYASSVSSYAQATLSIQGIVKKSNGVALEDKEYEMTFKLYTVTMPPSNIVLWDETISDVEVISGIYSVILGENPSDPLNIPFNADYELGVSIGNQEMLPRIRLTSAPYALSLRGETNQFPSTGLVQADKVKVAQGVIVNNGAPLVNNTDGSKGYSFNNDNDTGLFSTQDGKVSIYTNGVERFRANTTGTSTIGNDTIQGSLGANNINLFNNGGINYSSNQGSFKDWRLVDVDDINSGTEGWQQYSKINSEYIGWNSATVAPGLCHCNSQNSNSAFVGNFLMVSHRDNVLKKQFTVAGLPGDYTHIKVKFRFFAIDSWEKNEDYGFAGFATDINAGNSKIAWYDEIASMTIASGKTNTGPFKSATQFRGDSNYSDHWIDVEMTARRNGNDTSFWVFIGAAMEGGEDESFGIGQLVEVWVR